MGKITIKGLRILAHHGVLPQEQRVGNMFEIDICLDVPSTQAAMKSDSLEDTINYAEVVKITKEVMSTSSKLIEAVAYRVYKALDDKFGPLIQSGEITIKKLAPPIPAELDYVAYTYQW